MNAAIFHVWKPGFVGAVVVDLDANRVIAESPTLRKLHEWTRNQVESYLRAETLRFKIELTAGSHWRPEAPEEKRDSVHKPLMPSGCWAMVHVDGGRDGRPAHDKQCGQKALTGSHTCGWHVELEEEAGVLERRGRK